MRTVLVSGSAGTGTSSVAAALAFKFAADGHRVAIVHGDLDGSPDLEGVTPVPVRPLAWGQQAWEQTTVLRSLGGEQLQRIRATDVLPVPGLAELAWWGTLRAVWRGKYSVVVVDAGAIGPAVSWLTAPDTASGLLRRTWPVSLRSQAAASGLLSGSWHRLVLERLDVEVTELASRLRSPATSLHLVTRPAEHELGRLLRQLPTLALFELPATQIVLNGFSPRRSYDRAVQTRLSAELPGVQLRLARAHRSAPIPAALAAELYPDGCEGGRTTRPRIHRDGGAYIWCWRLPFVDAGGVGVVLDADDAIVTVGRTRRVVGLPSVLRRCRLVDASVRGWELSIRFAPDPQLWPADWEVS